MSDELYKLMQEGKPIASYTKACVGKISVFIIDPFSPDKEVEQVIAGNPFVAEDKHKIVIDLWSPKEKVYFERRNIYHIKKGNLIPHTRQEAAVKEVNYNSISDVEIEDILSQPFFTLKSVLEKITSSAAVLRILNRARDLEKSEKLVAQIETRLEEIQEIENPMLRKPTE